VPETIRALKRGEKKAALSVFARESARASSLKSSLLMGRFEKDMMGVPLASNSTYWSVSHKLDFVAGVVSKERIGIDLEQMRDVSEALFERIVDPAEKAHFSNQDKSIVFFRTFTAKEAVLKKTTHGMRGLSRAKIIRVVDDNNLVVQYLDKKYVVETFYFHDYLASVTKDRIDVHWTVR